VIYYNITVNILMCYNNPTIVNMYTYYRKLVYKIIVNGGGYRIPYFIASYRVYIGRVYSVGSYKISYKIIVNGGGYKIFEHIPFCTVMLSKYLLWSKYVLL